MVTPPLATCLLLLGILRPPSVDAFSSALPAARRTPTEIGPPRNACDSPPAAISPTALSRPTARRQTSLRLGGLEEVWSSYLSALEADPLLVKSVTAGVILGAADLAGQAIQKAAADGGGGGSADSSGGVDLARFARFAAFGLVLQAPWNHFYYLLLDGALPPTEDPLTATTAAKVAIDQFVQAPVFTVLIFGFLGALEGKSAEEIGRQLEDDYADTMVANWKLWVPATMVNIAFCPPILRVLFLNVVFFFWSIFLSLKLNKSEEGVGEI